MDCCTYSLVGANGYGGPLASIKKNILANYAGQFYLTVINIVMVPYYVKYMGVEAYGLVGFYALLQAWFQLLDIGLTPTLVRETARFQGGATDALSLRRLIRALEGVFLSMALVGCASMMLGAGRIAHGWLKVQQLSLAEVQQAILLMAIIVALRWVCSLYRGAINGFEQLVWLNGFNIIVATVRFVMVLLVFKWVGTRPLHFFGFQLAVAIIEVGVLLGKTYRLLPKVESGLSIPWDWKPLKENLRFSLSIAFTGSVWVLVTQTDKLILSKLLPLADYAYFSLAVLVASGVMVVIGPVSGALLPRLTRLSAEGEEGGVIALYRHATQAVAVIAVPAALVLAFFPEQVLWAWTGDAGIAHQAAPVLRLYALGNGLMTLAAFPYYLQFAKGDLRLHLLGNAMFVVFLIPGLVWATRNHGATGAGWVWLVSNAALFVFWTPVIHRRFVRKLHLKWLVGDVAQIIVPTCICVFILRAHLKWPIDRFLTAVMVMTISTGLVIIAAAGSSWVRARLCLRRKPSP